MKCLRKKLSAVIFRYLVRQLESGGHEFVYHLSSCGQIAYRWKFPFRSLSLAINDAFCLIQKVLVQKHGYHKCPHCLWACRTPSGHRVCVEMDRQETERREQELREYNEQLKSYEEHLKEEKEREQRESDTFWKTYEQKERE